MTWTYKNTHQELKANPHTIESSSESSRPRETCYLTLCGRLDIELFIRLALLSALCRLHYSPSYVWETISVPCFLHCYLLVVPAEMGLGSSDLSSSQGLLDKEPNIPLCVEEIGAARDKENVKKNYCRYLSMLMLSLSWIKHWRHFSKAKRKPPSLCMWLIFSHTLFWRCPRPSYSSCFNAW